MIKMIAVWASTLPASLLERHDYCLFSRVRLDPRQALPRTLNHFSLSFEITPRQADGVRRFAEQKAVYQAGSR